MEEFLNAPFPAFRSQAPVHIPIVGIPVFPQDGRFRGLVEPVQRVFEPVLQNPDEYLMPRYAPFVDLPDDWETFSGINYLGVQQHLQEEYDAPEQVEDMDNEEEDLDDENGTMDCTKASSQDVDGKSLSSQHGTKRDDSLTDDCLLLEEIGSSSPSFATIGLEGSAMPDASPAAFVPILESVPRISNNNL